MKYISLLLLLLSATVHSNDICSNYESEIEPGFRWKEADFTKEASVDALASLSKSVQNDEMLSIFQLPNSFALIEGYLLKREAVRALGDKTTPKEIVEYNVAGFWKFLINTPIYD